MAIDNETINSTIDSYVEDVKNAMPIDRVFLFGSHARAVPTNTAILIYALFRVALKIKIISL